jgi:hypothetical protein
MLTSNNYLSVDASRIFFGKAPVSLARAKGEAAQSDADRLANAHDCLRAKMRRFCTASSSSMPASRRG